MMFSRWGKAVGNPVALLIAASILLPLGMFVLAAWKNYNDIVDESTARAERTAGMLEEHTLKVLETHRLVIDQINERLHLVAWTRAGEDVVLHGLLKHSQEFLDQIATITITDDKGRMRASSRIFPADPTISFADRDWFIAMRDRGAGAPADQLYISKSYTGRQSGQSVFNVADRAFNDTAAFRGTVAVSVDRSYFEKFYKSVEADPSNSFLLVRTDGMILARTPTTDRDAVGADDPLLTAIQTSPKGVIPSRRSTIDGAERIVAYRKIGNFPLAVAFGIGRPAIFEAWLRNVQLFGLVAFLLALALLIISSLVVRHIRGEQLATERWQTALNELQAETMTRERLADQLRQSQKMDAVGRLTGGLAHDFNNLLTVIIGSLDLVKRHLPETEVRPHRWVQGALEASNRAASLTHRLLAFSRQQPLEPKAVDANKLVADMSEMMRRVLGETISIETVLAAGLWKTLADPNQLESALLNLAVNARDAMPDGGKLTVETSNAHLDEDYVGRQTDVAPGQYVMVGISDTGTGMPPETVQQAFEPFFTTKAVGKGTGLGLSQVYGFAKQSHGHVAIYSEPGQGTTVKLYLPRMTQAGDGVAAKLPAQAVSAEPARSHGETILVVEDEAAVRELSVATLADTGYRVLEAADGPSALTLLEAHPEVQLLFTDVVLVGPLNGRQLADQAREQRPDLQVLFTTGYTKNAIIHHGRLDEGVNFIGKPFDASALTKKVAELLHAASAEVSPAS